MRRALILALLAAAATAAPASAQSGSVAGSVAAYPVAGPAFGDGEIAWVEATGALTARLVVGAVGRPSSVLATAAGPASATTVSSVFGVSPTTALLYAVWETPTKAGPQPVGFSVQAGPRDALRPISGEAAQVYNPPQLAGDHLAVNVSQGDTSVIRFLDPVSGDRRDVPVARGYPSPYAVSGDLLAHQRPDGEAAVTNWRTGEELYRAQLPAGFAPPARVVAQPDGTAVWTARFDTADPRARHAVTSPQAPNGRELALPGDSVIFALAGNRVLLSTRDPNEYRVATFEGTVVAKVPVGVALVTPGLGAHQLGWLTQPCAVTVAQVLDLDSPPPMKGVPPAPCRAASLDGRPKVTASGLRIGLRCDGSEGAGCVTDVSATIRRRGRSTLRRGPYTVTQIPGEQSVVHFGRRRSLRGRLRVTVVLRPARGDGRGGERVVRRFRVRG